MVPLLGLTLALLPLQASETYVCRNIRPTKALALFAGQQGRNDRLRTLAKGEGMLGQVEADADDETQTIRVRGDKDEVRDALSFFQQIDNRRRILQGSIHIASPVDGVDSKISASLRNNTAFELAENESDVHLSLTPRSNADGTCTILLKAERAGRGGECIFRVRMGETFRVYLSTVGNIVIDQKAKPPVGDMATVTISVSELDLEKTKA